jgi:hypothetical protein
VDSAGRATAAIPSASASARLAGCSRFAGGNLDDSRGGGPANPLDSEHPHSGRRRGGSVRHQWRVWSGDIAQTASSGVFKGLDAHTGAVKKQFPPDVKTYWFHHRCYPSKATDNYILTSRNGIEFIDYEKETWLPNHWVRGGCIYGIMPCNGMVYVPPQSCGCYLESKLCGQCPGAQSPLSRLQRR